MQPPHSIRFGYCQLYLLVLGLFLSVPWLAQAQQARTSEVLSKAPTAEMLPGKGPAQGDWLDKVWRQCRAEFRANKASSRGMLVFLGD